MKSKVKLIALSLLIMIVTAFMVTAVWAALSISFGGSGSVTVIMEKEARVTITYESAEYASYGNSPNLSIPLASKSVSSGSGAADYVFSIRNDSNGTIVLVFAGEVKTAGINDPDFSFTAGYDDGSGTKPYSASLAIPKDDEYTFSVSMSYSGSYFESKTGAVTLTMAFTMQ